MKAQEIVQLLENPPDDGGWPIVQKVIDEASSTELIAAMYEPDSSLETRDTLCSIFGYRKDTQAVPLLLEILHDPSPRLRGSAAEALAKIEAPEAGKELLAQYLTEENQGIKEWYIIALGAVGYRPAIPSLIQALNVEHLRRYAALALGNLKAIEAKEAMQQALAQETDSYTAKLIQQGLSLLDEVS